MKLGNTAPLHSIAAKRFASLLQQSRPSRYKSQAHAGGVLISTYMYIEPVSGQTAKVGEINLRLPSQP